jgi:hypothetical protein
VRRRVVICLAVLLILVAALGGAAHTGYKAGESAATAAVIPLLAGSLVDSVVSSQSKPVQNVASALDSRVWSGVGPPAAVVTRTRRPTHLGQVHHELKGTTEEATEAAPGEPLSALCVLGGLSVGEAVWAGGVLSCETVGLRHRVTWASGDTASVLVEVSTDGDWLPVDADLQSLRIEPDARKILDPRAVLGITGSVTWPRPHPDLTASLALHWLHPTQHLSLLGVRASGNSAVARLGVDLVGYTPRIKPFMNTGLYLGVSYGTDGQGSIDLTLGVQL